MQCYFVFFGGEVGVDPGPNIMLIIFVHELY